MTPAARIQSAIEILDLVIEAARAGGAPADRILAGWFKERRFAGSKDRRAIRELVYGAIRACGPVPATGRAAMLRLAAEDEAVRAGFDGSNYGPAPIGEDEQPAEGGVAPGWLVEALERAELGADEQAALRHRAPVDVRVNTLKAKRSGLTFALPFGELRSPHGLRFPVDAQVEQLPEYREGKLEVQDAGSQLACVAADAKPGETVIDLCAGAGGKTLALAAAMENTGTLIASDTDRARLSKLGPRAERAGATVIRTILLDPGKELEALADFRGAADCVFVDAPCSGTGTWRRKPEAKWRLTPERLARYCQTQDRLLDIAAQLVRPGGRLVFVTCSLLDEEGASRIDAFLERNHGWTADPPRLPMGMGERRGKGLGLTPFHDGTDGFFIARLSRL